MDNPLIWIFGNSVQDVTVEVDIDTIIRDNGALIESIALKDTALVKKGSLFTTQFNGQGLGVELDLDNVGFASEEPPEKELYSLSPGEKYTLKGRVENLTARPDWVKRTDDLMVHCEDVSWGGGGINVCRFLRALAPSERLLEIRYTDYAMSHTFVEMIKKLEAALKRSLSPPERSIALNELGARVAEIMSTSMYEGERLISNVSDIFALYSPERCLEVFLASLQITPLLYRPPNPVYRRNWVFSNFHNAVRSTQDKIVCRSKTPSEAELKVEAETLDGFLSAGENGRVGAIILNSITHRQMFSSSYNLYRRLEKQRAVEKRDDFVGVLAMTKAMQIFVPDMLRIAKEEDDGHFPPFILIFNETEAVEFARALGVHVEPIIRATGDLPNVLNFAKVVEVIRSRSRQPCPRVYVTVGPRGSLGFDGDSNMIIHVSYYSRRGDIVFDTNACGDAYCAAITLLEWRKRCCGVSIGPEEPADEMSYFMGVATAAAYCKARDRRGRIDAKTIRSLLDDTYLGSAPVGLVDQILRRKWPEWVDSEGRAHRPPSAKFRGVTSALAELLRTKVDATAATAHV